MRQLLYMNFEWSSCIKVPLILLSITKPEVRRINTKVPIGLNVKCSVINEHDVKRVHR